MLQINGGHRHNTGFDITLKWMLFNPNMSYQILTFGKSSRFSGVKNSKFSVYLDGVVAK